MENNLGRRIQMLRESNMMTREDFAQRIGVMRKTVVDWEEGRLLPTAEQLAEISAFFRVDPRALVDMPADEVKQAAVPDGAAGSRRMARGLIALVLGLMAVCGAMVLMRTLAPAAEQPPASSSAAAEEVPLPECLALTETPAAVWDLDSDGEGEVVPLGGEEILFFRAAGGGYTAYALAEPLPEGAVLTAADGVFILTGKDGGMRVYSILRDGALWPAG